MLFIAPCKGVQDSLGFWIPSCGFRIPDSRFQISLSLSVEFAVILDSNRQWDSGFHEPNYPGFWISQAKISGIPESGFPYMGRYLRLRQTGIIVHKCCQKGPFLEISHQFLFSKKISKTVGIIGKARFYLSSKSLLTLYYSLVYQYLCYCNVAQSSTFFYNLNCIYLSLSAQCDLQQSSYSKYRPVIQPT